MASPSSIDMLSRISPEVLTSTASTNLTLSSSPHSNIPHSPFDSSSVLEESHDAADGVASPDNSPDCPELAYSPDSSGSPSSLFSPSIEGTAVQLEGPSSPTESNTSSFSGASSKQSSHRRRRRRKSSGKAKASAAHDGAVGEGMATVTDGHKAVTQMKLIIYGSRDVIGKNLYCKFYHGCRKHKTSPKKDRKDPVWNEWFPISHTVGMHSPIITVELWGSSFTGHSMKGCFEIDITYVLEADIIDDYFPLKGCKGEIRVKAVLMGPSLSEILASIELTDEQSLMVEQIHVMFPIAPYDKIINALQCHQNDKVKTVQYLQSIPPDTLARANGNRRRGMHLSPEERAECVDIILEMTPDVEREEIQHCLADNEFDITRTVDDLIKRGRTSRREEDVVSSPAYQLRQLESIANTGGFIAQRDCKTGEERILHQSVLRQGSSGLGKKEFDERLKMFEDSRRGGRRNSRAMKIPTQYASGELAV